MAEAIVLMKMFKLKSLIWVMHAGCIIILHQKYKHDNIDLLRFFTLFINIDYFGSLL